MVRFLVRVAVSFLAALVAIVAADLLVPAFSVAGWWSYVVVAAVYAVVQSLVEPLMRTLFRRRARMFAGGAGIISAFVALGVTNLISGALRIESVVGWVVAAVLVWVIGAFGLLLLPGLFVRRRRRERLDEF